MRNGDDGTPGAPGDTALRQNDLLPPDQPGLTPAEKTWTFMFYFGGDVEGMEKIIGDEIDLLEQVPAHEAEKNTVNIVVQHDRFSPEATLKIPKGANWGTWGNTRRGIVVPDQKNTDDNSPNGCSTAFYPVNENSDSEYSTGEASTLSAFITWAKETAPADHYALILFGHSASGIFGCLGDLTAAVQTSVLTGKPIKDWIKPDELQQALSGKNIDILVLDCCQLMSIETVAQLRGCCTYLIGSQAKSVSVNIKDVFVGSAFQYRAGLEKLVRASDRITPEQVAKLFIDVNVNTTASVIYMNDGYIESLLFHMKEYFNIWKSGGASSCISTNWNKVSVSQTRRKTVRRIFSKVVIDNQYMDLWWAVASTRAACGKGDPELARISEAVLRDLEAIVAYNKAFSSEYQGVSIFYKHPDVSSDLLNAYRRAPFEFLSKTGYLDCLWPVPVRTVTPGTGDSLSKALPLALTPHEFSTFEVHMDAPLTESYFSVNAEAGTGIVVEAGGMGLSEHAKMSLTLYSPESKSVLETFTGAEASLGGDAGGAVSSGVLTLPDAGTYGIKVGVLDNIADGATRFLLSLRLGDPESLHARAEVVPSSCSFVSEVGHSSQQFVDLRNTGLTALTITEILLPENTPFETDTWSLGEGDVLYPGDSRQLGIIFFPEKAGVYEGEIRIATDSSATPTITIPVSGQASVGTCSLQVYLGPEAAVQAGAQWRREEGAWNDSGAREPGILAGTYGITFTDIVGWLSPPPMEVTVSGNATVVKNGLTLYTAMKEGTGAIRVLLQPDTVTPADSKWRRVGTPSWMNAGTAENHVPAGWYDVEFAPVQGWKTPEPRTVRVTEGQTTCLHLHYEPGSDAIEGEGETLEGETPEGELQEGETVEPKEGEVQEGEIVEPREGDLPEGEIVEPKEGELQEGEIVEPREGEAQEGEIVEPREGELPEGEIVVPREGELPEGEIVEPKEGEVQEGEPVEGEVQEGELNEGETEEGESSVEGEGEPPIEGEPPVEQVTVPDSIGKSRDEAVTLLQALGLQVVVQEENSKAPKDEVIVQDPASGAEATPGDTITLTVSTGDSGSLCGCGPRAKSGGNYKGDLVLLLLLSLVLIVSNVAQRKTNTAVARKA